jgi:hypothetical protein
VWGGRNLRSATLVLVGALALAVIAVTIEFSGGPTFQDEVASGLAERSDAVAASLAHGNRCTADRDADRLRTDSLVAVRGNLLSPQIAGELLTRTRRLAQSITCPPPAAARPAPPPSPATGPTPHMTPPPRPEHRGEGKDADRGERGKGKKRGHHRGDGDSG